LAFEDKNHLSVHKDIDDFNIDKLDQIGSSVACLLSIFGLNNLLNLLGVAEDIK
jgi:hypothetical protein